MLIFPAIDLKAGRCVRLLQGEADSETVYSDDPVSVAVAFARAGAPWLHVVDLDGAFSGKAVNRAVIRDIVASVPTHVQVGGGIRCQEDVEALLNIGAKRVVIGTAAVENPELVARGVREYGSEAIAVGIDARDGRVATKGWQSITARDALALAREMAGLGVRWAIYTDITRDGMLRGPNIGATQLLARESGLQVIASGGVSSLEDVRKLAELEPDGVAGVIIGKALYERKFTLSEALGAVSATESLNYPEGLPQRHQGH